MNEPSPAVSPAIADKLSQTQPWLRFIAIMMFVGMGFMVLGGLACGAMGVLMTTGAIPAGAAGAGMLIGVGIGYLLLAVLYLFPALHLLRSARAIRELAAQPSEQAAVDALEGQRRFWKFSGISLIAILCLYVVAIAAALILPAIAAAQAGARQAAAQHAR